MPVSRMDSDRERILHYVSRIGDHVRNVFSVGGDRGRSVEEIKYIAKKKLIHRAITNIRIRLKLYQNHKRKNVKYIISAKNQAWFLYDLDIISEKNCILLDKIIDNENRRLSEKKKVLCQTADRTITKPT